MSIYADVIHFYLYGTQSLFGKQANMPRSKAELVCSPRNFLDELVASQLDYWSQT